MDAKKDCLLCRPREADQELRRVQVWEDAHWRLAVSLFAEVPGFSYLEPKRHIPHITDLDGDEARTFGAVMAYVTTALREVTSAEVVYVYVFGEGVPHLHVHLAPHRAGDALNEQIIKGDITEMEGPDGVGFYASKEYPPLPADELLRVALRIGDKLQ
jgi:diadenosine tetraphosphate (Ap4A) HIT family hydrolase